MKQLFHFWFTCSVTLCSLITSSPALSQVIPDATLPTNSSVTTNGNSSSITGGTQEGTNLFHSFEQFSIPTGGTAYFNNAADVQNIFSRVMGRNVSNIDGLIRANGTANLFLINPNGIIFGPNARLNIGGSFVASTARSLKFADGRQFSATMPQTTPILSISVPIGLQYGETAASIQVQESILQVQAGQTLALVGGNVRVEGGEYGVLEALGGRVELGGIAAGTGIVDMQGQQSQGTFRLTQLRFSDLLERADVLLTNSAIINVAASESGSIAINARNIDITNGSILFGGLGRGLGFSNAQAGDITLNANEVSTITESGINNNVRTGAVGNGGNINITTGSLLVTNGAQITASTSGQGNAGSIKIQASEAVSLNGADSAVASQVLLGVGRGGEVNITANSLEVTNGAALNTSTFAQGDAGNVNINTQNTVSFQGVDSTGFPSGAFSQVGPEAVGNGGNFNITTSSLVVTNGAFLTTSSVGQGDAGNVNINARNTVSFDGVNSFGLNSSGVFSIIGIERPSAEGNSGNIDITTGSLLLTDGAQLSTSTLGQGDAGSVNINARDVVSVDGVSSDGFNSAVLSAVEPGAVGNGGSVKIKARTLSITDGASIAASTSGQGDAGSVTISVLDAVSFDGVSSNGLSSGAASSVLPGAVGKGGGIDITASSLAVTNGAQLTTSSEGSGPAGSIEVSANSIRLDNQASLNSNTQTGQGNIFLNSQNLFLRRGSNITTNATGTATGGNITIDTAILAALEDSDISANAQEARGGQVIIDAQGIFGTQFREDDTPESDITASSNLGPQFSGVVEINTLDVDPSQGLASLPAMLIDTELAQACTPGGNQQQSEFIITGRGGLPPSPSNPLSSDAISVDWVTLNPDLKNRSSINVSKNTTNPKLSPIVEAQGWVISDNGDIVLTATPATATAYIPWLTAANCRTTKT